MIQNLIQNLTDTRLVNKSSRICFIFVVFCFKTLLGTLYCVEWWIISLA